MDILLKKGDKAPEFKGVNQKGEIVSSENLIGKKIVIYFYPKDDTPGCTAEACNLKDNYELLKSKGYEIIGVSADNETSHKRFSDKYSLPFSIIADVDKTIINAFGVWGKKMNYGREIVGINRITFIISEKGIIEEVISKVDTKNHTLQIIK